MIILLARLAFAGDKDSASLEGMESDLLTTCEKMASVNCSR